MRLLLFDTFYFLEFPRDVCHTLMMIKRRIESFETLYQAHVYQETVSNLARVGRLTRALV